MRATWTWVIATAVVAQGWAAVPAHADSNDLTQLQQQRSAAVSSLSAPLTACIDSPRGATSPESPVFDGCVTWASSVHAHQALYSAAAMSGDTARVATVEAALAQGIAAETQDFAATVASRPTFDLAVLLTLAREREQLTGKETLRPMAMQAAAELATRVAAADAVADPGPDNAAFALVQLHRWATMVSNPEWLAVTRSTTSGWMKDTCDPSVDAADGPFAPCLQRLAAVSLVQGATAKAWVTEQLGDWQPSYRRTGLMRSHADALNFTRGTALAELADALGRDDLRAQGAALVLRQLEDSSVWTTDYLNSVHWIPQHGMTAMAALLRTTPAASTAATAAPEKTVQATDASKENAQPEPTASPRPAQTAEPSAPVKPRASQAPAVSRLRVLGVWLSHHGGHRII